VSLSIIWAGWPVIGLLILRDEPGPSVPTRADRVVHKVSGQLGSAFYLLVLAAFLSTAVVYTGRLGVSLSMQMLSFSPRAVTATSAVGALVTIPIVLILGTLSDRLGRKGLLLLSYLLAAGGVVILSIATQFWQFGLTMVLLMAVTSANGSVATALATDLLEPASLSKGLSWLNATTWLGGVLGFAGAGYTLDRLGVTTFYLVTAVLAITAAVLVGGFEGRWWIFWSNLSTSKHPKVIPASKKV